MRKSAERAEAVSVSDSLDAVLVIRKQRACPSERGKVKDETLGRATVRERGGHRVRKRGGHRHAVTEAITVRRLRVGQRRHTWRALIRTQSFQDPIMRSANRQCGNCVSLRKVLPCAVCLRLPLHSVSRRKLGWARTQTLMRFHFDPNRVRNTTFAGALLRTSDGLVDQVDDTRHSSENLPPPLRADESAPTTQSQITLWTRLYSCSRATSASPFADRVVPHPRRSGTGATTRCRGRQTQERPRLPRRVLTHQHVRFWL